MKEFTMSQYATKEALYKAKAEFYESRYNVLIAHIEKLMVESENIKDDSLDKELTESIEKQLTKSGYEKANIDSFYLGIGNE